MKKTLLAVVAALAMVSCSQNEIDEIDNGKQSGKTEIRFNSAVMKTTRVAPMVTDNFKTFQVYGYLGDITNASTSIETAYLDDVITKNASNVWEGTKTYYWPATGNISFIAYSPATNVTYSPKAGDTGYPSFSYVVQSGELGKLQEDLVYAIKPNESKANEISLGFKHALTQVNFSAEMIETYKYTISSITISGVYGTGDFKFGQTEGNEWTSTGSADASYQYKGEFPDNVKITSENTTIALEKADGSSPLMLLPQPFETSNTTAKITVVYSVKDKNDVVLCTDESREILLAEQTWQIGKKIRYTLGLAPGKEVKFKATVEGTWGDEHNVTK